MGWGDLTFDFLWPVEVWKTLVGQVGVASGNMNWIWVGNSPKFQFERIGDFKSSLTLQHNVEPTPLHDLKTAIQRRLVAQND